jgi:hypothetical protein
MGVTNKITIFSIAIFFFGGSILFIVNFFDSCLVFEKYIFA